MRRSYQFQYGQSRNSNGHRRIYVCLSTVSQGNGIKVTRSLRRIYHTSAPPLPPRTYKKTPLAIMGYIV